tara:strand:- start:244 stop:474 length:231 start_codon:yes stop_codon:yes gene_type:complete
MKRELNIDTGILDGDSKRFLEAHITNDILSFRQRKSFDEYYWDVHKEIELDELLVDELSKYFNHVIIDSIEILISE